MKNIAIIPARGGSKRIPDKNIKEFYGKPIIAYSIQAAIDCGLFEEVMVSTDNGTIADIAKKYGAKVPFLRSAKNSDDYSGLTDVCIEVLDRYQKDGMDFDAVCCILSTASLIDKDKIAASYRMLESGDYNCVFTVVEYSYPIQRSLKIENNFANMIWPENFDKRSQDLEKTYHDAGQFYFIKTKALMIEKKLYTKLSGGIMLSEMEVQDIDSEIDWEMAKLKYNIISKNDLKTSDS
jgi:pseudaminic acid cytidylyltransferase